MADEKNDGGEDGAQKKAEQDFRVMQRLAKNGSGSDDDGLIDVRVVDENGSRSVDPATASVQPLVVPVRRRPAKPNVALYVGAFFVVIVAAAIAIVFSAQPETAPAETASNKAVEKIAGAPALSPVKDLGAEFTAVFGIRAIEMSVEKMPSGKRVKIDFILRGNPAEKQEYVCEPTR